ncbi:MAG: chromate transporter [Clostridia bacterium]|nr:chromate transporter [Clostridia bacterium]MBR3196634.1 chromate transporter [Clostridia bacterium]
MIYLKLFLSFLRVGCFAFGGLSGAIPLIRDAVLSNGWMSDEMFTNLIAVAESTPGPIMLNLATYVGSTQAGILGASVATLAVVLPSFIIIILVMSLLNRVTEKPWVKALLGGMKPCIMGIALAMGVYFILKNCLGIPGTFQPDLRAALLTAVLGGGYFLSRKWLKNGIPPIAFIVICAAAGLAVWGI